VKLYFQKIKFSIFCLFFFIAAINVSKSAEFSGDKLEKYILENIFQFVSKEGNQVRLSFENSPKTFLFEFFKGNAKINSSSGAWKFNFLKNSLELKGSPNDFSLSFDEIKMINNNTKEVYEYKLINKEQDKLEKIAEAKRLSDLRIAEINRQEELRQAEIKRQQDKIEKEKKLLQRQKELEEETRLAVIKIQEDQRIAEQKRQQGELIVNLLTGLFFIIVIGAVYYYRKEILKFKEKIISKSKEIIISKPKKAWYANYIGHISSKEFLIHFGLISLIIFLLFFDGKGFTALILAIAIIFYYDLFFVKTLSTQILKSNFKEKNSSLPDSPILNDKKNKKNKSKK
jgi:hypothetical protein